ncbi:MAG: S9 family peptidase [Ignavibacteria bacterium]|nr:MAG: S9 family peptidase [Ignavibacteria bacterium]
MTNDAEEEKNPVLSSNGNFVVYTKAHDLYAYNVEEESEVRLTNDGGELIYNGWASWVYYEEILGRSSRYRAFWVSPNSKYVAFLRFDDSPVPEFPIYHSPGQHGKLEKTRYPKAGDPDPIVKLGIANLKTGKVVWADFDYSIDQYIAWPFWNPEGNVLTVQWMNRKQDTLKIFAVDPEIGSTNKIYEEHQDSWVEWFEDLKILKEGKGMIIRSNKSGWAHLYYFDSNGKLIKQLTDGQWEVKSIAYVDEANERIFFQGWDDESTENHLFVVNLDGSGLTKLTEQPGTHSCMVSPEGKYFIDRFSNINTPTKIDIFDGEGKFVKSLGNSKSELFDEYNLAQVELFRIPTEDGFELPVKWFLPPDFDENKKYPVLISIYGGPNAGTVRNSFPYWMQQYYLAQEGIIVASVDHRGSGHFGKQGVAWMHRNLGKWEMNDYITFVKWLEEKPFVDSNKIAITGGSYGGYVTCMAMTYGSDYFDYGLAQYSVTDWHLYDNVYTERYMDTPEENPEGYKNGSVLTYADKYKGGLLITHGTIDDNVHMQNTLQFIDKLETLNKDFEMMIYPGERHGVRRKFMHAFNLSMKFFFKNLLGRDFVM